MDVTWLQPLLAKLNYVCIDFAEIGSSEPSFAELAKKFAQVRCKSPFEVESKNRKETLLIFFVFSR